MGSTIAIDWKIKETIVDNRYLKLRIWDGPGQERARRSFMAFLTKLKPLVLVYDITSKFSLDEVISLKREVDKIDFPDYRSIILVGNKVDLAVRHREVDKKFAEG